MNAQHGIPELQCQSLETDHSAGQLVELSAKVAELQAIIGERDQELDAVRRLNSDLTRQLNHPRQSAATSWIQVDMTDDDDPLSELGDWSPHDPVAANERIAEIKDLLAAFDATPWPEMNTFFYMHGYTELDLAARDLLRIIESERSRRTVSPPTA